MDFRVLGPLEAVPDSGGPALLRGRERQLLSVLLLFPGRPCSLDLLARALWPSGPPEHPAASLRVCVSRVRAALRTPAAASVVMTLPGAYAADPPGRTLDLRRFLSLDAAARAAAGSGSLWRSAALFRRALACWRDPPLADLPDEPSIAAEAGRLLGRRHRAALDLAGVHLALGLGDAVLPGLHNRVIADPLSARAWEQLVAGLSQAGRDDEALAACARALEALAGAGGAGERLRTMMTALTAGLRLPVAAGGTWR